MRRINYYGIVFLGRKLEKFYYFFSFERERERGHIAFPFSTFYFQSLLHKGGHANNFTNKINTRIHVNFFVKQSSNIECAMRTKFKFTYSFYL